MKCLVILTTLLLPGLALAQGAPAPEKPEKPLTPAQEAAANRREQATMVQAAIKQLLAEARELDDLKQPKTTAVFTRPHPSLKGWGPEMANEALSRMLDSFTGNDYRDTYVRWHLMAVVKTASQSDRRNHGDRLVTLIKKAAAMDDLKAQAEQPEYTPEPADVAAKWWALVHPMHVVVGYPPFQQLIGPPASFAHMDAAKRQKSEADWVVAQTLKWQNVPNPEAIAFNQRVRQMNWVVRQYRGELIYALFFTGDPEMARLITGEIARQANRRSGIALDLMSFLYLAAFDGALNLYPQAVLDEMSKSIEKAAKANEAWISYGGQNRNFADYAFHMIYMLRDGGGFTIASDMAAKQSSPRPR